MSVRIHSERPDRRDQTRRRVDGDEVSSGWSGNRSWWNRRGRRRTDCNACRPSRKGCRRRLRAEDPRAAELIFLRSLREPRWRSGLRKPANQTIAVLDSSKLRAPDVQKEQAGRVAAAPPLRAYGAAAERKRVCPGISAAADRDTAVRLDHSTHLFRLCIQETSVCPRLEEDAAHEGPMRRQRSPLSIRRHCPYLTG